ncbi:10324_t:CDS:1 [Dentiscutata erythropus]|uniref:10324_t:CDS:1 n=1 Tax=Dentiscutata erythropus TaxID=1348616 RepID=A0A9N9J773_9GLOM|nr:10324_t:CDS:1 [Dentiscutata erythropus]
MSDKFESVLSSYQRSGPNCQCEDKSIVQRTEYVQTACDTCRKNHYKCSGPPRCLRCETRNHLCNFNKVRKKRGPKPKLHRIAGVQRNLVTMEILIQAFNDTKKDLITELISQFNIMVGAGLYSLESPPSIQNNEGAASPLYFLNMFYNMPTGNYEIDSFCSRNIHSEIKEIVDNFVNKIFKILN